MCPGWIKTDLIAKGDIGASKGTNKFSGMVTPDVVAKKALRDAKKNRDMSVYSLYVKCIHSLSKVLPHKTFNFQVYFISQIVL